MLTSDDRFQMEAREVGAGVQELTERLVRETLTMAIAQDMHTLRSTPQGFAEILASYREERDGWLRDERLKPEAIDTEIKALKLRTVERLDLIDRAAKSAHERVMPKLAMHERGSEESPTESLARETAAARAWARWRPLLESGRLAPEALIERERENLDGLQTLAQELPDFMLGRGDRQDLIDVLRQQIRDHETALLPPARRLARALLAEIDTGMANIQGARKWANYELTADADVRVLPGWGKGESIAVE